MAARARRARAARPTLRSGRRPRASPLVERRDLRRRPDHHDCGNDECVRAAGFGIHGHDAAGHRRDQPASRAANRARSRRFRRRFGELRRGDVRVRVVCPSIAGAVAGANDCWDRGIRHSSWCPSGDRLHERQPSRSSGLRVYRVCGGSRPGCAEFASVVRSSLGPFPYPFVPYVNRRSTPRNPVGFTPREGSTPSSGTNLRSDVIEPELRLASQPSCEGCPPKRAARRWTAIDHPLKACEFIALSLEEQPVRSRPRQTSRVY